MSRNAPYMFRDALLDCALHFDFIRLRCGCERRFFDGITSLKLPEAQRPRAFIAFAEWDAVMITPSRELYPTALNAVYGSEKVVATFAGTSGYFTYLWDHPVNKALEQKLDTFARSGLAIIMSLRFSDAFRTELGLAGELLFCDFLQRLVEEMQLSGLVAHTLGWNDVVVVLHTPADEQQLTWALARIRLATFRDLIGARAERLFGEAADDAVFAASYSHLIAGSGRYLDGELSMGSLASQIQSATLLIRVMPPLEQKVREHIASFNPSIAIDRMPSEMGHYSFSVDLSRIASANGGKDALRLIASVRDFIGSADEFRSSYPETSTIFCFREPPAAAQPATNRVPADVTATIDTVCALMTPLAERLESRGASPMTTHRFLAVLTTLVDYLSDPVRGSVVRHLARFLAQSTEIISELNRDQIEDLCHICEYAMTQAIDGIAQFQHDANALGLTGRGGYNRLILAIEMYVQDVLDSLHVHKDVLITFGLRMGHAGAAGRFQIDIPFNVLFVPSRWYVPLHEAGHIAWVESFGWMGETLATYDQLEREIPSTRAGMLPESELALRVEFLRTREIIRELFPNLLVYRIACGEDLTEFDRLSIRRLVANSAVGQGTRELLTAAVLHALFAIMQEAEKAASVKGRAWWTIWTTMQRPWADVAREAASAIATVLAERDAKNADPAGPHRQMLVNSDPFREAVAEAVKSTIKVLTLSARDFTRGEERDPDLAERLFQSLQEGIDAAVSEQSDYAGWPEKGFAQWLINGEVLALAPGAHIWSKLLHFGYRQLKESKKEGAFMSSQLSVILSLWHRAVTTTASDELRPVRVLYHTLIDLDLVKQKVFSD